MKILNTTTGKLEELIYAPTGSDCLSDLTADDSTITYNRQKRIHEADAESISWWRTWIAEQEQLDALLQAVKDDLDADSVEAIRTEVEQAQLCDMEDQPRAGKAAIMAWLNANSYSVKTYADGSIAVIV